MVDDSNRPDRKGQDTKRQDLLNRRGYLRMAAAAVGTVASSSMLSGQAEAATSRDDFQFDTVLHAVEDVGLDPTGSEPMGSKLEAAADDNTLIEFPDGEFLMNWTDLKQDLNHFGLAAASGASPVLKPAGTIDEYGKLGLWMGGSNLLMEGFTIDVSGPDRGMATALKAYDGKLLIQDIHIVGLWTTVENPFHVKLENPDEEGLITNLIANDGQNTGHSVSANPVKVEVEHAGDLHITDSEFSHWGKAIYDPSSQREPLERGFDVGDGNIHVDNCYFHNNNAASIRTGSGSTIRNSKFVVDDNTEGETVTWEDPVPTQDGIINARHIRCKGDLGGTGVTIEDCTFLHTSSASGSGIIQSSSRAGGHTVRNCSIRCDSPDIDPIRFRDGSGNTGPSTFENVTVVGTGGRGRAAYVYQREDMKFRNCCFNLSENDQDGIVLVESSNVSVLDSDIAVPGDAVVFHDSTGTTENVTHDGSCSIDDSTTDSESTTDSDGSTTDDSTTDSDSTTDEETTLSQTLTVRGTGTDVDYTIETTDGIVAGGNDNIVTDPQTTVSGTVAGDGEHWYWWDGEIVDVSLSDKVEFYVNGELVDPSKWDAYDDGSTTDSDSTTDGETTLSQTLTVRGTGTDVDYTIETTDGIVAGGGDNSVSDPNLKVSGTVAGDGEHWFWWDGEIVNVSLSDDAELYTNGEAVDPDAYAFPHTIVVEGRNAESAYKFDVTGAVTKSHLLGSVEEGDVVDDGMVTGSVDSDLDGYRFSGELTSLKIKGDASVTFE